MVVKDGKFYLSLSCAGADHQDQNLIQYFVGVVDFGMHPKDFASKPFDFVEVQTRIYNMLEVRLLYRKLDEHNLAARCFCGGRQTDTLAEPDCRKEIVADGDDLFAL